MQVSKAKSTVALQYYAFIVCLILTAYFFNSEPFSPAVGLSRNLFAVVFIFIASSAALLMTTLIRKKFCILNHLCFLYDLVAIEYLVSKIFFQLPDLWTPLSYAGLGIAASLVGSTVTIIVTGVIEHRRKSKERYERERNYHRQQFH